MRSAFFRGFAGLALQSLASFGNCTGICGWWFLCVTFGASAGTFCNRMAFLVHPVTLGARVRCAANHQETLASAVAFAKGRRKNRVGFEHPPHEGSTARPVKLENSSDEPVHPDMLRFYIGVLRKYFRIFGLWFTTRVAIYTTVL